MNSPDRCSICGEALIQKNRSRLILGAVGFLAAVLAIVLLLPSIWFAMPVAVFSGLISACLFVLSFVGKAPWCRQCKRVRTS
jgi:Flp pilus assembly protein TadB